MKTYAEVFVDGKSLGLVEIEKSCWRNVYLVNGEIDPMQSYVGTEEREYSDLIDKGSSVQDRIDDIENWYRDCYSPDVKEAYLVETTILEYSQK